MTRLEPDGGGGGVGINPQLLQSMINTMNSSAGDALNLVYGYISQLSRVGLDTSSLSKAVQDLNWAQDQIPMLNRRQSLAQAMAEQNPGMVDVSAGAGALGFPTTQAAQAAGKADGTKALQAIGDHSNDDFILTDLSQYADDPAYLAAFFSALGPQGLAGLGLQVTGYQQGGDQGRYQSWANTVGQAFATASYQMPYKSGWLGQLQLPDDPGADPGLPQLSLIQPFLEHGVYSSAWLDPLGKYAIQQAFMQQQPGLAGGPPVSLDGIWTALSNNPAFDAQFYQQNFTSKGNPADSISGVMSSMYMISVADSAFARMVQSATVAPALAANSAPYAANAQLTVQYFGNDSSLRTSGPVRAVFGTIAENYFDDLAYTVRAAAPGIGPKNIPGLQVTASESQWGNFVVEAMRDKSTSAQLLAFYSSWANGQPIDDRGPGLEQVPQNQGFWNDSSLGLLNDFLARSYQGAGAPAGGSPISIADVVAAGGIRVPDQPGVRPGGGSRGRPARGGQRRLPERHRADAEDSMAGHRGIEPERRRGTQPPDRRPAAMGRHGQPLVQRHPRAESASAGRRSRPVPGPDLYRRPDGIRKAVWRVFHQGREDRGSRHDRREPAGAGRLQRLAAGSGHRQRQ